MAGRGDGQKLGQPSDHREHENLKQRHQCPLESAMARL
jgi:hypothetical protein